MGRCQVICLFYRFLAFGLALAPRLLGILSPGGRAGGIFNDLLTEFYLKIYELISSINFQQ